MKMMPDGQAMTKVTKAPYLNNISCGDFGHPRQNYRRDSFIDDKISGMLSSRGVVPWELRLRIDRSVCKNTDLTYPCRKKVGVFRG